MNKDDLDLLTAKEVAQLLQCSERKIWRMTKRGELSNIHLGHHTRWKRSVIDQYIFMRE